MSAISASPFANEREEAIWLTGRLTELVAWAKWLIDAADRALPELQGYLQPVSYTHLRAHETVLDLVCRLLLEKKTLLKVEYTQPLLPTKNR